MDSIHDAAALTKLRERWRIDPHHVRQLRNAFYKSRLSAAAALEHIPATQRAGLASGIAFHALELHSRHDSRLDGASKLLFRTATGRLLEAVILRIASEAWKLELFAGSNRDACGYSGGTATDCADACAAIPLSGTGPSIP